MEKQTAPIDLKLPAGFPFPAICPMVDARDAMFTGNAEHYLSVGLSAISAIERGLNKRRTPGISVKSILDMPCHFGRVTRTLRAKFPDASIDVCDVDQAAVDFCANTFSARGIYSKTNFDELLLPTTYDLIWVGSLITHLDVVQLKSFLRFVVRFLAKDGIAVVTSGGAFVAGRVDQALRDGKAIYGLPLERMRTLLNQYLKTGFGYVNYPSKLGPVEGDYGITIATYDWILAAVHEARGTVVDYAFNFHDHHHDVVIFQKSN